MGDESFGSTLRGPCRSIQQSLFSLVTLGNARSKHGLSWRCLQDTSDTGSISSGADVQVCRTFGRHEFFPCCSDITGLDGRDVYYTTIHKLYDIKYTV